MKTAVEWLLENLISEPYSEADFKYNAECWDKAKEIEKQQIIDAYCFGCKDIIENEEIFPIETSEQYYNETFNNED